MKLRSSTSAVVPDAGNHQGRAHRPCGAKLDQDGGRTHKQVFFRNFLRC